MQAYVLDCDLSFSFILSPLPDLEGKDFYLVRLCVPRSQYTFAHNPTHKIGDIGWMDGQTEGWMDGFLHDALLASNQIHQPIN